MAEEFRSLDISQPQDLVSREDDEEYRRHHHIFSSRVSGSKWISLDPDLLTVQIDLAELDHELLRRNANMPQRFVDDDGG